MHEPRWALFYDFHTMPAQPDVGERFDADAITDAWKERGVDYVVFHARCNLGMAYYDTRVGIRHPSLRYDLFGRLARACQQKGIALSAYFNVGLSHEEGLRHRDWCVLSPEGYTYLPDRMDHFMRRMCYNTAYADHLCEMIREVATGYPVAGFFLDCMHAGPCVGVECVREMKRTGVDWRDPASLAEFGRQSQLRMARRIRDTALSVRPDLLLYFNGVGYEDQQDIGTYLEFECLPTGGWGYEALPVHARYLRTLGKPVLNMSGRFHRSWGDFGGIRTEPSLEYDLILGLANGLRPTIGDHWHPRGEINGAVLSLVKAVYGRLRTLEPYLEGATPVCDVAVVSRRPPFDRGVLGATRMLSELKAQFDVVTTGSRWKDYRLLVLPDHIVLDEDLAARIRVHLDRGGAVLSSGWSGLDKDTRQFRFSEWGLRYAGEDPAEDAPVPGTSVEAGSPASLHLAPYPSYFEVKGDLAAGMPDMPLNCYVRGIQVVALEGTRVLARQVSSYFPRHWDGEHHHLYIAPNRPTEQAFVASRGSVAHITHPVFGAYYEFAPVPLKQLAANLMAALLRSPVLRCANLPSFARATVTRQQGRHMVYLTSYVPERRGAALDMIEEPIVLRDVTIGLATDRVSQVYGAVSREPLSHELRDGYTWVTIAEVRGWYVAVFEER